MTNIARDPRVIAAAVLVSIAAGTAVGFVAEDVGGGVAMGLATLGWAAFIAWDLARLRTRQSQFSAYAAHRGLTEGGRGPLPAVTNILRGDTRLDLPVSQSTRAARAAAGSLPGGIDGILAHFTWSVGSGSGSTEEKATIVLTTVPEAAAFSRRVFFRGMGLARNAQAVPVESAALAGPQTIEIGLEDDPNRARQIFSPTFVHWLEGLPLDFSFEFDHGYLVCARRSHAESYADLDWLCATTAKVADRFRSEALESPPTDQPPAASLDPAGALTPADPAAARDWMLLEVSALILAYVFALAVILAVS
jgi:hypothetical protein